MIDIMRTRRQQRVMRNHAGQADAQAQFEAVVRELLGRTIAIIGLEFEAFVALGAGVSTYRQGQGINRLNGGLSLLRDFDQTFLNRRFDLPEVSRLADKARAVSECVKEMPIMVMEISEAVTVFVKFEEFAADFHRNDFFVSQRRLRAAAT